MKRQQVFWIIIWFLSSQVWACLFKWCKRDTNVIRENIVVKKRYLYDTKFTPDQKHCIYGALVPVVRHFCRAQSSSVITRLIAAFLWSLPATPLVLLPNTGGLTPYTPQCALSSQDTWLVEARGTELAVWEVTTARQRWRILAHEGGLINHVILSSNDQYIITVSHLTVKVWLLWSGTLYRTFPMAVTCCALSRDNQLFLSRSYAGIVSMWLMETELCTQEFTRWGFPGWTHFFANDRCIAFAQISGIEVWQRSGDEDSVIFHQLFILHGEQFCNRIGLVTFSTDEQLLLQSVSITSRSLTREEVCVWRLSTRKCIHKFETHTRLVSAAFVRENSWIISINRDHILCIWRVSNGRSVWRLNNYSYVCNSPVHSYWYGHTETECIIVATENSPYEVHVLAVESGERLFTFKGYRSIRRKINSVCVLRDGRYMFSGNNSEFRMYVFSETKQL